MAAEAQVQLREPVPADAAPRRPPREVRVPGAAAHARGRLRAALGVRAPRACGGRPPRARRARAPGGAPVGREGDGRHLVAARRARLRCDRRGLGPAARARAPVADRRHVMDRPGPRRLVVVGGLLQPAAARRPAAPRRRGGGGGLGVRAGRRGLGRGVDARARRLRGRARRARSCSGPTGTTSRPGATARRSWTASRAGASPASKLDFLESDRAPRMRFMAAAARAAARRELVVAFHGVTVPRGFQRTWPNALTFEGVYGAEHAKSGRADRPAPTTSTSSSPATRSARWTTPPRRSPPAARPRRWRTGSRRRSPSSPASSTTPTGRRATPRTRRRSPCSRRRRRRGTTPGCWRASPACTRPSRGARGRRGSSAACRRRPARIETLRLGFLAPGRAYTATVVTDDGAGGLAATARTVTAADAIEVPVAADGGFTVQLAPA